MSLLPHKIHLQLEGQNRAACGSRSYVTTEPKVVTCRTCKAWMRKNKVKR